MNESDRFKRIWCAAVLTAFLFILSALGADKAQAADEAPGITSAKYTTFTVGTPGSFTVTTTGSPIPALSESGALPSGVTFTDNGNGTATLSGTPAAATGATYNLTFTASNGVLPDDTQGFTLTVNEAPSITKTFGAASIPLNGTTSLSFTINNPNGTTALTGVAFTDNLPAGLAVATPNGLSGSYGGGTVTATPGSGTVSLSGAALAAGGSCTFSVDVQGTTAGVKNNTTGNVTSTEGGTGNQANAMVEVLVLAPPVIAKSFGAATIPLNGTTTLSFTITNPNATTALTGVAFTDFLPPFMVVATPNGLSGSCGGGTVTATAGSGTVSLSGAALAAGGSCTFSVDVKGTVVAFMSNWTNPVTSTNGGTGNQAHATVVVLALAPPAITSPNNVTFVAGNPSSFTVTTNGAPVSTITRSGTLPSGITFTDNGNGTATLSGTPAAGSVGTYNLIFTAQNGIAPNATQNFVLTVDGPPGVHHIDSNATTTFPTPDNALIENEHTAVAITQLLVVFNKDMNAGEAGNWQNYHLVRDGSPGELIDPAGVTYDNGTRTTTLGIVAPVPLPDGRYTLTVEGDIRDTLGVPIGTDFVRHFTVDLTGPAILSNGVTGQPGGQVIINGGAYSSHFTSFTVSFNEDVGDAGGGAGTDDVTNPLNYLLLQAGANGTYDTTSCQTFATNGNLPLGDDTLVPTGPVIYTNNGGSGPFTATVNGGLPLADGGYRLLVSGTTSIVDLAGNPLIRIRATP